MSFAIRQRRVFASLSTFLLVIGLIISPFRGASGSSHLNNATDSLPSYRPEPSPKALKWADKELKHMSIDEKIGQLISIAVNATFLNRDSDAFRALQHQ